MYKNSRTTRKTLIHPKKSLIDKYLTKDDRLERLKKKMQEEMKKKQEEIEKINKERQEKKQKARDLYKS